MKVEDIGNFENFHQWICQNMMVIFQSQAQECVYESLTLGGIEQGILQYLAVAQEASMVSHNIFEYKNCKYFLTHQY